MKTEELPLQVLGLLIVNDNRNHSLTDLNY